MEPSQLLVQARTVAVVGCSGSPGKAAHQMPALLQRRGWNVVPVNPRHSHLLGATCYPRLADIPEDVDLVDVFRPSDEAAAVAEDAVPLQPQTLWLQLGIASDAARKIANDAGIAYVENACAGALAERMDLRPAV